MHPSSKRLTLWRLRRYLLFAIVVVLLLYPPSVWASEPEPMVQPGWEEFIRTAIFTVADTDYEPGIALFQKYIDQFPDAPEGYFFYAAAVQEKMMKRNDLSEMDRFNEYARKTEKICTQRLARNKDDTIARMLYGAIYGYKGLLEAKQRNLITAFFNVIKAETYLARALHERDDLPDTFFGLGMVYYSASRKSEEEGGILAWTIRRFITDGVDRRQEGIGLIEKAIAENAYGSDYARSALMWIRLFDHHYDEAEKLAEVMVVRYTRSALVRWVLGRIALQNNECDVALGWFDAAIAIKEVEETKSDNPDPERYRDLAMVRQMALRCSAVAAEDYSKAQAHHLIIGEWLAGDPKVSLEYQDEKNLLREWRQRQEQLTVQLKSAQQ